MAQSHVGTTKPDQSALICYHPVFCTADIPPAVSDGLAPKQKKSLGPPSINVMFAENLQTIDLFLQRANDYIDWLFRKPEHVAMRPLIFTSTEVVDIPRPSQVPSAPFDNPFIDQPMTALGEWFDHNVSDRKDFTDSTFLVLDEHSAEYESVAVVCTRGGKLEVVNCEFGVAMEISMVCDLGTHTMDGETLGQYVGTEKILTKEAWLG